MSKKIYEETNISDIASAIREKNGSNNQYTVAQMAGAVRAIKTQPVLEELNASENGTYTPSSGKDGFSNVIVNVPNTFGPNDNGKVVNNGSLSAQTSRNLSANGTYDTTFNNSVIVDVSASINLQSKTITKNGIVTPDPGYDGLSQVTVDVAGGGSEKYHAVHVWTKSTGGNDAALYIQDGYFENSVFTGYGTVESLNYQNARSDVAYYNLIAIQYGAPWRITALAPVVYNSNTFDENDIIATWDFYNTFDGIIADAFPISGQKFVDLSVTVNGTFLPTDYYCDAFNKVIVNVPQNADVKLVDGTAATIENNEAMSIREYFMYKNQTVQYVAMPSASIINSNAFTGCGSLIDISFPACKTIGAYAFSDCSTLSSVYMPLCESILDGAFRGCLSLSEAIFPECKSIGLSAFISCAKLSKISFPACKTVGERAFFSCYKLSSVYMPLCENVLSYAFYSCSYLSEAIFPECQSISNMAFAYCSTLSKISFPACKTIGAYAFSNCSGLSSVYMPLCERLSGSAFQGCSSLEYAKFDKCSIIYPYAFVYDNHLLSVYFLSNSVASLSGSTAFHYTPMQYSSYTGAFGSIFVPESLVEAYKSAGNWSYYSDRITAYTGE